MPYRQEIFFRPGEVRREPFTVSADLYNHCRLLLKHSDAGCVFVPIRRMQFQGVITDDEVLFIDSLGGYAVHDGQGGRVILIAWRMFPAAGRTSLSDPLPTEVIHYREGLDDTQRRLLGEFNKAIHTLQEHRGEQDPSGSLKILPFGE